MTFYVYILINLKKEPYLTYVGYTKDLKKRLNLHNKSKGAKFTKGRSWQVIYAKKYKNKSIAMKEEYKLKKNYKLRNIIKNKFLKK